ncbi:MAG: diguanylate cyclase [Thermodesulfobacteriota bacterium]
MNSLKESISNCRINAYDDDNFINEFNKLAKEKGKDAYQAIIQILTDFNLKPDEAEKWWFEIIKHRENISNALGRQINLMTAISDYCSSMKKSLKNYKILDINTFEKIKKESTHDNLTGLFNKGYFKDALNQHISLAKRHNTDLSVVFLDIDDFKEVNDTLGHDSGDIVLKEAAKTMSEVLRASDIIARFGGDEFVILMPNTDKLNALLISERISKIIKEKTIKLGSKNCQITLSGGVAGYPIDADKAKYLLKRADSALYRAKGAGKNRISLFKKDKRRFLRIKFSRPVKVKQLSFNRTRTLSGISKNIAIGGILFSNKESLPIGAKVQVSIAINKGSDPLLLIGTIVRVEVLGEDNYDIGMILSFKEMEKIAKDEISKFLIQQSQ